MGKRWCCVCGSYVFVLCVCVMETVCYIAKYRCNLLISNFGKRGFRGPENDC